MNIGDRVVCGANVPCDNCVFCLKGEPLLCLHLKCFGVNVNGGLAEYCAYGSTQVHRVDNLSNVEAVLVEPMGCAVQLLHRLHPRPGSNALILGSGPAGILLAQLLKQNGAHEVGTSPRHDRAEYL